MQNVHSLTNKKGFELNQIFNIQHKGCQWVRSGWPGLFLLGQRHNGQGIMGY